MTRSRTRLVHSALLRVVLLFGMTLAATTSSLIAQEAPKLLGRWPNKQLRFRFNPNFPTDLAGSIENQMNLIECAANVWEKQTRADFRLLFEGQTATQQIAADGINTVFWTEGDGNGALASTFVLRLLDQDGQPTDEIIGFDMAFFAQTNGTAINWSGIGEPGVGRTDITGVAVHEFGHALGLEHADDPNATMFAFATSRGLPLRTLNETDRFWIESSYGLGTADEPAISVTGAQPDFGPGEGGGEVLIIGDNFTFDSETIVRLDGLAVSRSRWIVESCDRLRITDMPPRAEGSVDVTVENSIGSATLENGFRYGPAPPSLSAIEPAIGPLSGGIDVTITGANFEEDVVAMIGEEPLLSQVFVDEATIVGTLPRGIEPGTVDVTIIFDTDVTRTLESAFVYNPFELTMDLASAAPGSSAVSVSVLASSPDPLEAASFGLVYDASIVSVTDITVANTDAEGADIARVDIDNDSGSATFNLFVSLAGDRNVPAGVRRVVARVLLDVAPSATVGALASLELADRIGSPPTLLALDPVGLVAQEIPVAFGGGLLISEGIAFVRGEANDDGMFDFSDAIAVLNYLFLAGDPSNCLKSMDANDDGKVDVSDAVRVLDALFGGARALPPPHPNAGLDPTPDEIPCDGI